MQPWLKYAVVSILAGGFWPAMSQNKKKLSLDDIYSSTRFQGKTVADIQWLPDGSAFTFTRANNRTSEIDIYRHDAATGQETLILRGDQLTWDGDKVVMTAYRTTGNQNHLLITGARKQIWRHSFAAPYFLYRVDEKKLVALAGADPDLQNVALSPDGRHVGFAKKNNLHVAEVSSGSVRQLTNDGSDEILNGIFDWVYEEEFGRADAFRWSPDSKRIAFWRIDQSQVKTFTLLDEIPVYSVPTSLKYPKVGEANATVRIGVVSIESASAVWIELGSEQDIYIPRIEWTNRPDTLAIQRLNRRQNKLELLFADIATGKTRTVITDQDAAWIDVTDDFLFLENQESFLWTSERSGYRHIYLTDYDGIRTQQLTSGDWEVVSLIGVDEESGWVYFNAKKDGSIGQGLYRTRLSGSGLQRLSEERGWHSASFSPNFAHYVGSSSTISQPTVVSLCKNDGSPVRVLEANKIDALDDFNMVYPEFGTLTVGDGAVLNTYMMKPADFDPAKKHPVIVFGYGGPGSQMVLDRWGAGGAFRHFQRILWHQYMTERGYLIFCVDNRGTGGKGKTFKNLAYGDISKWAVNDQIEGAKYLAGLPYVDASRIGFWGWSGGGYLTCMMLTRGADYFKTGVAVASVSDFRNYDTIWTERYMGLLSENAKGYDAANVLNYADLLKGKLLLIHGTGDDNVHPGNTLQFADVLIAKNKQFDLMLYPNRNHRIDGGNTMRHLFTLITNYFLERL